MNFSLRICKIEKEGALLKFPLSKDYCALIFSTIDIRCNRFAGPLTAKREVNSTIAIIRQFTVQAAFQLSLQV